MGLQITFLQWECHCNLTVIVPLSPQKSTFVSTHQNPASKNCTNMSTSAAPNNLPYLCTVTNTFF